MPNVIVWQGIMASLVSRIHDWFLKTSVPDKYGLYASILLMVWLAYLLGRRCTCWVLNVPHVTLCTQRLVQFPLPGVLKWMDVSSYLQCLVVIVLITFNSLAIGLHAQSWTDVQKRSGSLAVIHLLPLCTGFTFSLPADVCHVSRHTFAWIHRWIGRICVLHCLLHGTIVVDKNQISTLTSRAHVITLVGGCCLLTIPPLTYGAIIRRHPQLILKAHYILAVVVIAALAYHLIDRESPYRWVLLCGACLWISLSGIVWIQTVWSQKSWRHRRRDAVITLYNRLLWIDVTVPPCWEIRPGQYVQVWMPRSGILSCFHLPTFYVTLIEDMDLHSLQKNNHLGTNSRRVDIADSEANGRKKYGATKVRMLRIVTRPNVGLTGRLAQDAFNAQNSSIKLPIYVMGPYSHPHSFDKYGTVLFIVEDIGLFRVLPFIQNLVQGSRDRENAVRKLEVLWQVQITNFDHPHWVKEQIQKILDLDRRDNSQNPDPPSRHGFDILHFKIHLLGTRPGDELLFCNRTRLSYHFCEINPTNEVTRYMNAQCGKMVVAVCANPSIRETVKNEVVPRTNRDLRLIVFDLEPCIQWLRDEASTVETDQEQKSYTNNVPPGPVGLSGPRSQEDNEKESPHNALSPDHNQMEHGTLTVRITENEHEKWIKQKIAEGW